MTIVAPDGILWLLHLAAIVFLLTAGFAVMFGRTRAAGKLFLIAVVLGLATGFMPTAIG